ncbi:MAG: CBS domain-containing protein [Asgard group archaeon]|nr:CBS domain-containing protein [Asgard group archaeon]
MDSPAFVNEDDNILTVIKQLLLTKKGCVLVNRMGKTIGIISDRDIHRLLLKEGGMISPSIIAKDFMVKPVIMIKRTATLSEADRIMHQNKINRLPVIEKEGSKQVIGIINFETVHSNLITNFAKNWINRSQTYSQ